MLPFRVYKLTVYEVPGCKPEGKNTTSSESRAKVSPAVSVAGRAGRTWERVGAGVSGDGPCDRGVCATAGRGSDQVASDGFFSWTPGQCERIFLDIGDAHAARGTDFCMKTEKQVFFGFVLSFKKRAANV